MLKLLFYTVVVLIPFGRVLSIPFVQVPGKTLPILPIDAFVWLLIATYTWRCITQGRIPFLGRAPGMRLIAIFLAWSVMSLVVNGLYYDLDARSAAIGSLYLLRWFQYAALLFIVLDVVTTIEEAKRLIRFLFGGALLFCLFGLVQAAFLPDFALTLFPDARPYVDYDPQGHRLVSTILDPNIAAAYILVFALVSLAFFFHGDRKWLMPALVFVIALLATLSRGGVLGFLGGFLALSSSPGFPKRRVVLPLALVGMIGLGAFTILEPHIASTQRLNLTDESATNRIEQWQLLLHISKDNPVFGIGFNLFAFVAPEYGFAKEGALAFGASGDLLMVLVMTGWIGLSIYLLMLVSLSRTAGSIRNMPARFSDAGLSIGVRAALFGVFINSAFSTSLLYPHIMALLWCFWGICLSLSREGLPSPVRGGGTAEGT